MPMLEKRSPSPGPSRLLERFGWRKLALTLTLSPRRGNLVWQLPETVVNQRAEVALEKSRGGAAAAAQHERLRCVELHRGAVFKRVSQCPQNPCRPILPAQPTRTRDTRQKLSA